MDSILRRLGRAFLCALFWVILAGGASSAADEAAVFAQFGPFYLNVDTPPHEPRDSGGRPTTTFGTYRQEAAVVSIGLTSENLSKRACQFTAAIRDAILTEFSANPIRADAAGKFIPGDAEARIVALARRFLGAKAVNGARLFQGAEAQIKGLSPRFAHQIRCRITHD